MNNPRITLTAALLVSAGLGLGVRSALAQPADLQPGVQTSADAAAAGPPAASAQSPGAVAAAVAVRPAAARTPAAQAAAPAGPSSTPGDDGTEAAASAAGAHRSAAGAGGAAAASSVDRIELGTTEISGNRELPKLLYVVPWRRDQLGDFAGRPPNSLVDEALTPVDRTVFQRQNRYYAALQAASEPASSQAKSQPVTAGAAARRAKDEK